MNRCRLTLAVIAQLMLLHLGACSQGTTEAEVEAATRRSPAQFQKRWYDAEQVEIGRELFQQNCATCHGLEAQGALAWTQPGPDGKYPPPPLNGSGHAWHHPLPVLYSVIRNGSPGGQGNMPAWREKLDEDQIVSVIAWFQDQWPDEIYTAWLQRQRTKLP